MRGAPLPVTAAEERLGLARRHAREHGVTRLADVTGLDRLGVPVWQAIRPSSRALSVHQGKGLDAAAAQLGALMEAIESSNAEAWDGPTRDAAWDELPPDERLPRPDDLSVARTSGPREPLAWTRADRLDAPGLLWVPAAAVSLDLTWRGPEAVDRSSNGQAAGFDLGFATAKALFELIERDAVAAWLERSPIERLDDLIDVTTIEAPWFVALVTHLRERGVFVRCYHVPAVIALPVVVCEVIDFAARATAHKRATGWCCHADPDAALRGAVLEALQSRLTGIAGSRDDIAPDRAAVIGGATLGVSLPPPPGHRGRTFGDVAALAGSAEPGAAVADAVAALGRAGYPGVARIVLSPADAPVAVVKLFAPGLGAIDRSRRPPVAG